MIMKTNVLFCGWFAPAVAAILLFCSCSTMNKNKKSASTHSDITISGKLDSAGVSKNDSSGIKTKETISSKKNDSSGIITTTKKDTEKITVTFSDVTTAGKLPSKNFPPVGVTFPANDYDGAPMVYDITVNGKRIKSTQPIKNVVVENESGKQTIDARNIKTVDETNTRETQSTDQRKSDSVTKSIDNKSRAVIDSKSKEKTVKRTGATVGIWLPVILIVIGGGFCYWYFGMRRRKPDDKNKNTLTSVPYDPPPPPMNS